MWSAARPFTFPGQSIAVVSVVLLSVLATCRPANAAGVFNVVTYGAGASGESTVAFKSAFAAACSANGGTVLVPSGTYMVQPFEVKLCTDIVFQVEGTVTAPALRADWNDYTKIGKKKGWIQFDQMSSLTVVSNTHAGTFDGKASMTNWWSVGSGKAPISLSFTHCPDLVLRGFTVRNSPGTHIQVDLQMIEGQQGLLAEDLTIDSDGDSPNTDGIHLSHLWNAVVRNSRIGCGDDCVVFQTDCKNILVENIFCGPGHGVSLGSLGNGVDSCMSNILVQSCTFANTQNGVRIKAWPERGGGAATGITFRDMKMVNVKQPIIVSQCYVGGTARLCSGAGVSVPVYDVLFENIYGTCLNNEKCITVSCLGGTPCVGITMKDIALSGTVGVCNAAYGTETNVSPSGCLKSGNPPMVVLSNAAARVQTCGYGSNGFYTTNGLPAPGSSLLTTTPRGTVVSSIVGGALPRVNAQSPAPATVLRRERAPKSPRKAPKKSPSPKSPRKEPKKVSPPKPPRNAPKKIQKRSYAGKTALRVAEERQRGWKLAERRARRIKRKGHSSRVAHH